MHDFVVVFVQNIIQARAGQYCKFQFSVYHAVMLLFIAVFIAR